MRQSVRNAFRDFTAKHEGVVPFMYLDVKGYVTTAIGNLIDSVEQAARLPWYNRLTGEKASREQISQAWHAVKSRQDLRNRGGMAYQDVTDLRLTGAAINELVEQKAEEMENELRRKFPAFDSWPADAQLGLLSMAWAMGPAFSARFPRFTAAISSLVPDFVTAAHESRISDVDNPGVKTRNEDNRTLFLNAAKVQERGMNANMLYWPLELTDEAIATVKKVGPPILAIGTAAGLGIVYYLWQRHLGGG